MTRSNISSGFIELQPLSCTQACDYRFIALAVHPPQIYGTSSVIPIWIQVGGLRWSFSVETISVLSLLAVFIQEFRR